MVAGVITHHCSIYFKKYAASGYCEYFDISVDELLGMKPLRQQEYLPSNTDNHNSANGVLKRMIEAVKKGGLVICIDVNREFENDGLYIDGMDYENLCTAFDFHKVWKTELEQEGRDYAIGIRLPFYMHCKFK